MTIELKRKFLDLYCALSPENLSCDGELPEDQVREQKAVLRKQWQALEAEMGRDVSDDEVETWIDDVRTHVISTAAVRNRSKP